MRKDKSFKIILIGLLTMVLPNMLWAQAPEPWAFFNVEFIACVICGVLLALGFQWLLSTLSIAAGVTIAGKAVKKSYNDDSSSSDKNSDTHKKSSPGSTGVKISSAIGGWAILTMSLSVFFATLLAVKLSLATSNLAGITLGLVIWATFLLIMSWLDAKAISNFTGGLIGVVSKGVRASIDTVTSAFSKSDEAKMRSTALAVSDRLQQSMQHTADQSKEAAQAGATSFVDQLEKKLKQDWDAQRTESKIDQYIQELKPEPVKIDYERMRREAEKLINEISVEERVDPDFNTKISEIFMKVAAEQPNIDKKKVRKIAAKLKEAKADSDSESSKVGKAAKVFDKLTPGSENDAAQFRSSVEDFLRSLEVGELDPNELEHDLEQVINNPNSSREFLKQRFNEIDHDTIVHALSNQTGMSPEKADAVIEKVENAFNRTKSKLNNNDGDGSMAARKQQALSRQQELKGQAMSKRDELKDQAQQKKAQFQSQAMEKKDELQRKARSQANDVMAKFENRLRTFFNSMDKPEFNYDRIKRDLHELFSKHYTTSNVFKRRAKEYDRDSVVTLMAASNKNMSKADARRVLSSIEQTRNSVVNRIKDFRREAQQKALEAQHAAERQAEGLRKTTTTAAWMIFSAAAISGVAAALGGMLAFTF